MTGGKTLNLTLKMLELFLKIQENIRISILKRRLGNLYKKENFRPEIKPMIENLQDELSRLVNKQAKSAKLLADIRWKLEGKKCSKTFFKLKDRISNVWLIHTDDINQSILAVLRTLSNLKKKSL